MDRIPLPPPFAVGTVLRYRGTRTERMHIGNEVIPLIEPGLVVSIKITHPGQRGTLVQLHDEDGPMVDDDGEPIRDRTTDGRSVYEIYHNGKKIAGRAIYPNSKHDWEVVE